MYFAILIFIFSIAIPSGYGTAKGPTISELQKKITELTKQVKDLTTKLNAKTTEANKLKKEKTTIQNQVKSKENIIQLKQNEIDNLIYEIENKDRIIEEQNKKIQQLEQLSRAEVVYTDRYLNVGNDVKWYKFKTKYTDIYMTHSAFAVHGYIIDISDRMLADVGAYYEVSTVNEQISTYIWNGKEVLKNDGAVYESNLKRISLDASQLYPINRRTNEDLVSIFAHEYSHVFQIEVLKMWENNIDVIWLHEGTSHYINNHFLDYSKYNIPEENLKENTLNRDNYGDVISQNLSNMGESNLTILPTKRFNSYETYTSLVYYLEKTYGHSKLLSFFKDAIKNPDIIAVLQKHFDISEEQFIKDWKRYFGLI